MALLFPHSDNIGEIAEIVIVSRPMRVQNTRLSFDDNLEANETICLDLIAKFQNETRNETSGHRNPGVCHRASEVWTD